MLRHNLKTAYLQINRNKTFTMINITGLVIGITAFLLILNYVRFEWNYDSFHQDNDRIYRVRNDYYKGNELDKMTVGCPPALGPALKDNFSEVEAFARLLRSIRMVISNEQENRYYRSDNIYFAEESFLDIFSFTVINGQKNDLLKEPGSTVITESFAHKTFGNADPVGKVLRFKSRYFNFTCSITAVLKDIPDNSHIHFDALVSMPTYLNGKTVYGDMTDWNNTFYFTYVKLKENVNPEALENKLPAFIETMRNNSVNGQNLRFFLEKLNDIHLNNNKILYYEETTTSKQMLLLLLFVGIIILVIAWVNFINLSTSKALDRAKEVGVKKISGASKYNLVNQFLLEAVIFNTVSILISLILIAIFKENIIRIFGKSIDLNFFTDIIGVLTILGLLFGGVLISGAYPAFIMSSYNPQKSLKGKQEQEKGLFSLRKVMVVIQFAASLFLIAGVFAIFKQVKYLQNKDLGINADQLVVLRAPVLSSDSLLISKITSLKEVMKQYPEIKSIAGSYYIPGKEIRFKINIHAVQNDNKPVLFSLHDGDINFIPSFGFKILCGRAFTENNDDDKNSVILNETGIKALGYNTPESIVGQKVYLLGNEPKKVIGVIADYHQLSAKNQYEPICLELSNIAMNYYTIKISTNNVRKTMDLVENIWKTKFPEDPFDFFFLDEFFNRQYKADIQFGKIFTLFTLIAVFIACLGLFGLSYHATKIRTKEIGIRKSMGSSIPAIMFLLMKDTLILILFSALIGLPFAQLFISGWLHNYAFQISISWWFFILPLIFLLIIALGTICFNVIKTANTNPVQVLRYE